MYKNARTCSYIIGRKTRDNKSQIKSNLTKNEESPTDVQIIENISKQPNKDQSIPRKFKCAKKVGNTLFLILDKYDNPLFIIGPHFPLFIFLTLMISAIMLILYLKFWQKLDYIIKCIGVVLFFLFFLSYTYTSLINPGYPKNNNGRRFGIPVNDYYFCEYCKFYVRKSAYASHCKYCQICIEKIDHHCGWTGHCIGKNNKITFYIFSFSLLFLILYFGLAFYLGLTK